MLFRSKQNGQLTPVQEEQLDENTQKLGVLQKDIDRDTKEKENHKKEVEKCKSALLEIHKTLYPQVSIYIFDGFFMPKKEEEFIGMICKNNLIKSFPL